MVLTYDAPNLSLYVDAPAQRHRVSLAPGLALFQDFSTDQSLVAGVPGLILICMTIATGRWSRFRRYWQRPFSSGFAMRPSAERGAASIEPATIPSPRTTRHQASDSAAASSISQLRAPSVGRTRWAGQCTGSAAPRSVAATASAFDAPVTRKIICRAALNTSGVRERRSRRSSVVVGIGHDHRHFHGCRRTGEQRGSVSVAAQPQQHQVESGHAVWFARAVRKLRQLVRIVGDGYRRRAIHRGCGGCWLPAAAHGADSARLGLGVVTAGIIGRHQTLVGPEEVNVGPGQAMSGKAARPGRSKHRQRRAAAGKSHQRPPAVVDSRVDGDRKSSGGLGR